MLNRREFMQQTVAAGTLGVLSRSSTLALSDADAKEMEIIDTHQHLWNRSQLKLAWLTDAPDVLQHDYGPHDYAQATQGLRVRAVYMEVDVDPSQHDKEAEYVVDLCRSNEHATIAAVIGGRPASPDFEKYIRRHKASGYVKGVRQVLHVPEAKRGQCLQEDFVRGVRLLGNQGLSFDLCMRPTELKDGVKLAELCPDTRFILDHCGNADPKAFGPGVAGEPPWHDAEEWKRDIADLAKRPNMIVKISGIVARAQQNWKTDDLAPIVNHCLDTFGPERVIFGGDWPVCLLGAKLSQWVTALRHIVASRPAAEQRKLWSENARRFYSLQ